MKYYCLSNDRGNFNLYEFEAKDDNEAWEIIEEGEGSHLEQNWLLDEEQLNALKEVLK